MTQIPESLARSMEGTYNLERELGRGGMATVYLAEDVKHRRRVAVKVLHPELAAAMGADRFVREIEIAARLTHPHILMLIDSGEADGHLFYVMPFVDGESLQDRLSREGPLPLPEAIRIIDQVASALSHAHGLGVVHRDVKPANILLTDDQAIVADFGIARAVEMAGGAKLTGTGLAIGTPAYMSPEQAFEQDAVDGRSDVYAMGCVLFEMLAGRTPFEANKAMALFAKHASEKAPSLCSLDPNLPLFVDRAVGRALAKDPAQRFSSPRAFTDTLRSEAVIAPVDRRRVAVLPPVNIGSDADRQYLVLGLHEGLISQIGQGDLGVLARTSVLQYEGTQRPAKEICRELEVDAVVESSLFCVGESLGVQARLVDGRTEESLWSGSYDGDLGAVLSFFREVTGAVADEVHRGLGSKPKSQIDRPIVDPVAYERYMRGRVYQQSFNPADLDRALQYFEAALEIQPDYAPAHAGISLVWGSKIVLGIVPGDEFGPEWVRTAEKAVELDPNLAEAHQVLAQAHTWYNFDWPSAEAAYKKAIELDPNEPQARIFYSHFLAQLHRVEESDEQIARALEIDPFNPFTQMLRGIQRGLTGRHDEAIDQLMVVPPNPLRSFALSWQHFRLGNMAEGLKEYRTYFELLGDEQVATALREDGSGLQAAMVRGAEVLVERSKQIFVKPNNMIHLFGWGGDIDRAVEWFERSYQMRDHEVAYMGALGISDDLRADPRFNEVLRRLDLEGPAVEA
jgi:TolB-like protein/tetratricopeptide (TPR) repeat protein/tRNA A-37 threonylcarbamoyl transferase component Bud32